MCREISQDSFIGFERQKCKMIILHMPHANAKLHLLLYLFILLILHNRNMRMTQDKK